MKTLIEDKEVQFLANHSSQEIKIFSFDNEHPIFKVKCNLQSIFILEDFQGVGLIMTPDFEQFISNTKFCTAKGTSDGFHINFYEDNLEDWCCGTFSFANQNHGHFLQDSCYGFVTIEK